MFKSPFLKILKLLKSAKSLFLNGYNCGRPMAIQWPSGAAQPLLAPVDRRERSAHAVVSVDLQSSVGLLWFLIFFGEGKPNLKKTKDKLLIWEVSKLHNGIDWDCLGRVLDQSMGRLMLR